jgi:hypothetical protein
MLLIRHRSFALRPSAEICHIRSRLHSGCSLTTRRWRIAANIGKLPELFGAGLRYCKP